MHGGRGVRGLRGESPQTPRGETSPERSGGIWPWQGGETDGQRPSLHQRARGLWFPACSTCGPGARGSISEVPVFGEAALLPAGKGLQLRLCSNFTDGRFSWGGGLKESSPPPGTQASPLPSQATSQPCGPGDVWDWGDNWKGWREPGLLSRQ